MIKIYLCLILSDKKSYNIYYYNWYNVENMNLKEIKEA